MSVPMITRIFQTVERSFSLVQINWNGSNGHQWKLKGETSEVFRERVIKEVSLKEEEDINNM